MFNCVPLRTSTIPAHITLDTASIIELFKPEIQDENGHKKKVNLKSDKVSLVQEEVWEAIIKKEPKKHRVFREVRNNYKFDHIMYTDGVSISLSFISKQEKNNNDKGDDIEYLNTLSSEKKEKLKYKNINNNNNNDNTTTTTTINNNDNTTTNRRKRDIVGIDPGKGSLIYMVGKNEEGEEKQLRYTSKQKRTETRSNYHQKDQNKKRKENRIDIIESDLKNHNSKTVNYGKFAAYLVAKSKSNKETKIFYEDNLWRKRRLRVYSNEKKSIDKLLNKIGKIFGDDVVIGYGDWSSKYHLKYSPPTINKGLRKKIKERFPDTYLIDEYNTSQTCCQCNNKDSMEKPKDKNGKEIYKLFKCNSCSNNGNIVIWNRDFNAGRNILGLTEK